MNYFLLASVTILLGLLIMSGDHEYDDGPQTCSLKLPTIGFGVQEGQWNYNNVPQWGIFPNSSCNGQSQSPIDLDPDMVTEWKEQHVDIEYNHESSLNVRRLPHTMEVTGSYSHVRVPDASGHLALYRSIQFHLHVPSEHTVKGKSYPLEIHFVHLADKEGCEKLQNKISVLGIFVEIDEQSTSKLFSSWTFANEGQIINGFSLYQSIMKTIEKDAKFYSYTGSLTTPPCTETVNWFVMEDPITITNDQFAMIKDYFRNPARFHALSNNRPVTPMNGRKLSKISYSLEELAEQGHGGGHGGGHHGPEQESLNFLGEFTCCFI